MTKLLKKIREESGQAMVEMAICLPILLLLVLGILDFGWIFYHQINVENASREGARYAIVNQNKAGLAQEVAARAQSLCGGAGDTTVTFRVTGSDAEVTVTQWVHVLTPLAGIFAPDQVVALTATTVMKQD